MPRFAEEMLSVACSNRNASHWGCACSCYCSEASSRLLLYFLLKLVVGIYLFSLV